ncbi:hypothetical protein SGLAD_v1c01590 [Spiroplasma gladiatoris]|uniref:Flavodoxin-like domain-containing protein n=1 Tax=Spiroplasma gladiatoris TaxID=2143 RepID=A0A4P7AI30_9MOLU|nr:flavodoxin [Spiroplasma gladiatoris]QBQ07358.1 hypothetical protein SGLAD_v1c01590 [Spiroplasma gladiatoris]
MKKILKWVFSIALISNLSIGTVSCSTSNINNEFDNKINENTKSKTIVVYFSWSNGTETMANYIANKLDVKTFKIERELPYSSNYSELSKDARNEAVNNLRPKMKEYPEYINNYDYILLGFPIWWHVAPMIIGSFLEHYNLDNKRIFPFIRSSAYLSEHLTRALNFLRDNSSKDAIIEKEVYSSSRNDVDNWLANTYLDKVKTLE